MAKAKKPKKSKASGAIQPSKGFRLPDQLKNKRSMYYRLKK